MSRGETKTGKLRILFVCTGNLCRSPMAEAIARHIAEEFNLDLEVRSAGTSAMYGEPMTPLAEDALRAIGVEPHDHYSKPVDEELLNWADLVLVMTDRHLRDLSYRFGGKLNLTDKLYKLDESDIEDPYGGTLDEYIFTANRIRDAILKWLRKLKVIPPMR